MKFINVAGVMQRARRYASQSDNVQDEQVKDPVKLGEILRGIMRRVTAVEATVPPEALEFEVNVGASGALTTLTHNFGQNVRYYVTDWRATSSTPTYARTDKPESLMSRAYAVGTWTASVSSVTIGGDFRLKANRAITGIRFGFNHSGKSIKCSLWRADTGALLASKTVTSGNRGFYEAIFDTPVTTDLTGVDITVGIRNTTDNNWTYNNDTVWALYVPYELNADLRAVDTARFFAGDGRPDTTSAGGYFMVEPILGDAVNAGPVLMVDSTTTTSALVLKSYVAGKAVIRVEPTQNGASL